MQMALRQVEISSRMFQVGVAHQKLDRPQVSSGFHQGRREAVAKRVRANPLFDSGAFRGFAADVPDCMILKSGALPRDDLQCSEISKPSAASIASTRVRLRAAQVSLAHRDLENLCPGEH